MTNSIPQEVDVLVVGYGPVGAAVGCLLGLYGVRTLIIDKEAAIYMAPRAIALDNEALRILQMIGLADDAFEKVVIPHVRMHSPYVGHFGTVNTKGTIDGHPKLVTFYQPDLERALREKVASYPCVTAACNVELLQFKDDGQRIVADMRAADGREFTVVSKFLIGADGANSKVRKAIGQEFVGLTYGEDWLIVDAKDVPNNIDHVEFICNPHRPTPHMVAPGGRTRWEFMLAEGESREEMEKDESIKRLLAPWAAADEIKIERKAVYRFSERSCERYSKGRAFLVGDAAHVTPPFVGQGLVGGLRDAANLSWKLAWVVRGQAGQSMLDSYDQERRPHAVKMITLAKNMGRMIMPRNAFKAVMIQGFMKSLRIIPPVRKFLEDFGPKPKNEFDDGLLVRGRGKLRRGGLVPQFRVRTTTGAIGLSDDQFGAHFTLVGFGVNAETLLSSATQEVWSRHGGKIVSLRLPNQLAEGLSGACEILRDEQIPKSLLSGWCAVVRPDRSILHDGPASNVDQLILETLALMKTPVLSAVGSNVEQRVKI